MLQVNLNDGYGRGARRCDAVRAAHVRKVSKGEKKESKVVSASGFAKSNSVVQGKGQWAGALILAKEVHILLESHEWISRDMTT